MSTATSTLVSGSWLNPCLVVSVFTLALYFVFLTGCRPQEAAYVVHHKKVRQNPYYDFADRAAFIAETPADFNKTDRDYVWLVPLYDEVFVALEEHFSFLPDSPFKDALDLCGKLDYWFNKTMKDAKLPLRNEKGQKFTMRSIRCYRATEWVRECAECKVLKQLEPPNPLQHEKNSLTVKKNYAQRGADSELEAYRRCREKYPDRMKELYF